MSYKDANRPKFLFKCDALDPMDLFINEIKGHEKISGLYTFDIVLFVQSKNVIIEDIINTKATLYLYHNNDNEFIPYSGFIETFEFINSTGSYSVYRIILKPTFWKLTLTTQCRVFQKMTIPDILKKVLDTSGIYSRYEIRLSEGTYPENEYVVQYNESDFNFISRLMDKTGIWYLFDEPMVVVNSISDAISEETLIITDSPSEFMDIETPSPIKFKDSSGMINQIEQEDLDSVSDLEMSRTIVQEKIICKNYNYRTPDVTLEMEKRIQDGDMGTVYNYGGNYKNTTEADSYSTMLSQRIATKQVTITGKSNSRGLRSGKRFSVEEHTRKELNQPYIITEVTHTLFCNTDSSQTVGQQLYYNAFTAIPSSRQSLFRADVKAQKAPIPDIMTAKIEGTNEDYATIDEKGRYKVRMHFDRSDAPEYQASKYIRLAQEYSGSAYGAHFPTHKGSEMIIAHVNGDPDKPIGLRVVPNGDTISPVKSSNKQQSIIRTAGGNEIVLDDTDGKQQLNITTPGDMYLIADHDESESAVADRSVDVGGNETKTIDVDHTTSIGGNTENTISGNKDETVESNSKLDVTLGSEEEISGNQTITVTGEQTEKYTTTRKVEVTGNNTENISGNLSIDIGALSTIKVTGNLTIKTDKNVGAKGLVTVLIDGMEVKITGEEAVVLESGAGVSSVIVTKDGINIKAPTVTMTAAMIESKATLNNNVTGLVVMLN